MKTFSLISVVFLLVISSQACLLAGNKTAYQQVLFSDNFSDPSKNWDQVISDSGSTGYYDGAYRILVNVINAKAWASPGNESFNDTRIEVNATKNSGPDNNDFGIICRYLDADRFYYAVISSDGYYGIMKMTANGSKLIGKDSLLESNTILKGSVTNHLRLDCIGSTITLYVNGNQVDQQSDMDYTTGNVGLLAGTFDTPGADILFDNFFVYKP